MIRPGSSPQQTFVLFPLAVVAWELARPGRIRVRLPWLALMAAGYALYRRAGEHRAARGAGSRGFAQAPDRLVTDGPYAWSRNPMYLGHLLFMTGLVLATGSPIAFALALRQWARFTERVAIDEERLERLFGDEYRAYRERVPRWLAY